MLLEPTALAATASAIAEAVEPYGCDPDEIFSRVGLTRDAVLRPGRRVSVGVAARLWAEAREATNDPCIGLFAGQKIRPAALHALGLSWLASSTPMDGLRRVVRYSHVVNTALNFELVESGDYVRLIRLTGTDDLAPREAIDGCLASIVRMCRLIATPNFAPVQVSFRHPDNGHIDRYIEFFRSPIHFSAAHDALLFDRELLEAPQPAGNQELAVENDRIADRYLATLHPERAQDRVRQLLITLLPAGEASQATVAARLHRSVSALQRQLRSEGVSYREVLDDTRKSLAEQLVRERRYTLSQIAFLLGFQDQANFSRAFKRWTGTTPSSFRSTFMI